MATPARPLRHALAGRYASFAFKQLALGILGQAIAFAVIAGALGLVATILKADADRHEQSLREPCAKYAGRWASWEDRQGVCGVIKVEGDVGDD